MIHPVPKGDGSPIKVVIADDEADARLLVRLSFELDPRFEVAGEASNGREALEVRRELHDMQGAASAVEFLAWTAASACFRNWKVRSHLVAPPIRSRTIKRSIARPLRWCSARG